MNGHKKGVINIDVRFRDIDSMGHVNNAVFFTYFEEGRKEFLRTLFNIVEPMDYSFILASIGCDFLRPVKLGDSITLQLWIGDIGEKRFSLEYRLVDTGDESIVYAKGRSVQVFFDYEKNKTAPIPKDFLEKISDYIE
ncbi:MAG: acyl-CoA thioesterase [Deltaproteobacteria bacterium]|nr:acyl-CoA thioesterase [Deltaproteobacteria bacterium]MBW2035681.1 acyl-CoA thioesterase [Deltaproteobacteria bacterium]MBW2168606.1 acyl-CoA thioesterase [Deltaproteobacteria bacterium]